MSLLSTAPAGEGAGALVVVGAVTAACPGETPEPGADDGRVVVVDRPRPPEDWRVVLVVEEPEPVGTVGTVVEEVELVGVPASSAGTEVEVVDVVEGSEEGTEVVEVVADDDGSVGGIVPSVVEVVTVPPS